MNYKPLLKVGIFAAAGIAALMFMLSPSEPLESRLFGSIASTIDALPPSGAGLSMSPAPTGTPSTHTYLGGTRATGRVAEVYVRAAENVFLAVNQAPAHLQKSGERWVDIEFPDLLADDVGSARAILNQSEAGVQVGDVVEIKFAHKSNPRYFPVKEVTRVTQFVARKDEMLAKDFERRIIARNRHGAAPPDWLARARTAPTSGPDPAAPTTTADASR
ncbi:MAG: hypothetical protein IH605_16985 [Burkholderiales bacterium]|nr:hypothetical protein [Burkholderiales bacterium]